MATIKEVSRGSMKIGSIYKQSLSDMILYFKPTASTNNGVKGLLYTVYLRQKIKGKNPKNYSVPNAYMNLWDEVNEIPTNVYNKLKENKMALKTKDKYKKGDKVVYTIEYGASPMLAKSKAEQSKEKVGRISKATKDFLGKPQYVIDNITIGHANIKGLAENKQGENTMKITKNELVEMIKGVIKEETEYQAFFKEKLGGRNLGDMSDEEKKAFFADVDKEWKGKGESGGEVEETLEPIPMAAGEPEYNPTQRLKAKKRDQILAKEQKVEQYLRKIIREELKFVMFNEVPSTASRKVAKKRILQTGSTTKSL